MGTDNILSLVPTGRAAHSKRSLQELQWFDSSLMLMVQTILKLNPLKSLRNGLYLVSPDSFLFDLKEAQLMWLSLDNPCFSGVLTIPGDED